MAANAGVLEQFRMDGRVALVVGGTRGLGRSIAEGLAEAGATVALCSRHLEEARAVAHELERETGRQTLGLAADVASEGEVTRLFADVHDRLGAVDALVNSAGINARYPIEECPLEEFRRVIEVNLTGTWLCCRAAMACMKAQGRGAIVNVGSALSAIGLPERTPYCSSKAAIIGLTQTVALEGAPHGVRCNALCPGPFLTEMNRPLLAEPEKVAAILRRTALNRWAEMHEIRGAALFLASDASSFMTGAALYLDGGWTAQ
ncbi:MAG: SDR family oxidoreductase [Candidatus Latescibacterota bacterium]